MGVANPSAQGHAMMTTATAWTTAAARDGSAPSHNHRPKVKAAHPSTTGTNQPATRSAKAWIGARVRWAAAAMSTIRASTVSAPTRSAVITKLPRVFRLPPITGVPGDFSTGCDSPVSMDSSTAELPVSTVPSTGIRSPGLTLSRQPGCT